MAVIMDHLHQGIVAMSGKTGRQKPAPSAKALEDARNLFNFLSAFFDKQAGTLTLPPDDEIVKGVILTRDGKAHNGLIQSESPDELTLSTGPTDVARVIAFACGSPTGSWTRWWRARRSPRVASCT